jgi:hypothetical protein
LIADNKFRFVQVSRDLSVQAVAACSCSFSYSIFFLLTPIRTYPSRFFLASASCFFFLLSLLSRFMSASTSHPPPQDDSAFNWDDDDDDDEDDNLSGSGGGHISSTVTSGGSHPATPSSLISQPSGLPINAIAALTHDELRHNPEFMKYVSLVSSLQELLSLQEKKNCELPAPSFPS